jgi:uncharacterized membrane protein YtjA (UPF0391 family)
VDMTTTGVGSYSTSMKIEAKQDFHYIIHCTDSTGNAEQTTESVHHLGVGGAEATSTLLIAGIVVVIAIAVLVVVIIAARRKHKGPVAPAPEVSEGEEPDEDGSTEAKEKKADHEVREEQENEVEAEKEEPKAKRTKVAKTRTEEKDGPSEAGLAVKKDISAEAKEAPGSEETKKPLDPLDEILMLDAKTEKSPPMASCPKCGEKFEPGFTMCPACGYDLEKK